MLLNYINIGSFQDHSKHQLPTEEIKEMSTPTEIEKKSLEAHVELCAERYKNLEQKLDSVENRVTDVERKLEAKIDAVEAVLDEIKDMIVKMQHHRNNQLISWGVAIIATLLSAIGFLLWNIISKLS